MTINNFFPTDSASIFLLVLTSVISFILGRFIVTSRAKKRQLDFISRQERALRERPPEPESKNKSKRKRQLQQLDKAARSTNP